MILNGVELLTMFCIVQRCGPGWSSRSQDRDQGDKDGSSTHLGEQVSFAMYLWQKFVPEIQTLYSQC